MLTDEREGTWLNDVAGVTRAGAEASVRHILKAIGEDPDRDGLHDTPSRVIRAFMEMTDGYGKDVAALLARSFEEQCDTMVAVTDVEFTSLCEHHMLPFTGTAIVGYLPGPGKGVVGLSKLARLVDVFAHRLQIQERMTQQIAEAIETHLEAAGVGVRIRAKHSCMGCRGARKPAAEMVTTCLLGEFRDEAGARAEFLALA